MTGKIKIIVFFCSSILLLLIVGFYSYSLTKEYRKSYEWVSHSQQVISEAQELSINLQEMESAQRGFIITGNPRYLTPHKQASAEIVKNYSELQALLEDNQEQKKFLDSIYDIVKLKIDWINVAIDVRKHEGFRSAEKMVLTNRGEVLMQQFRSAIGSFIENEKSFLNQRIYTVQADYESAILTIVLSVLLALIMVLTALYFFIKDYNRRLHSKKRLLESENRTKKFLEALPLGIFVLNKEGKSYYSNSKANALFGTVSDVTASVEDIEMTNLPEAYQSMKAGADDLYPVMELPIMRALYGEKNVCVEDLEMKGDGKRIPLRVNATSVTDSNGNIEYAIAVFEDITETREANNRLKEAKKIAEQAVTLKEAFLANMSHEIRTPMNAIIGFTSLLLKGNLDSKERDYVQTIKSSGENLMRIINDILDVSKMESGMMSFETHAISINQVFSSLQAMLTPRVDEKNLVLSFHCSDKIPESISGDPTRLTQILLNILGNAIKFTSKGSIEVYADLATESNDNAEIVFSVYDSGIGIATDKIDHVFERFTQAESHTTRQYGGTGLGLSIVKQLVELQGGWIKVTSEIGAGSVFTFSIPFKKSDMIHEKKSTSTSETDIRKLSEKRILLVEDNPINVKFIQGLFSEYNIDADHAANGREAVDILKSKNYDIVLMDIEMPEMNGYKATGIIRNELQSKIPIIAMTANAMAGESEKCLSLGMNAYLSKPINEHILFEKMVNLLEEKNENSFAVKETEKLVKLDFLITSMRGKHQLIRETIDVFFSQMNDDLTDLNEAFLGFNHDAIKRISHRMKSTVSIIGANRLEIILAELETLALAKEKIANLRNLKYKIDQLSAQAIKEVKIESLNYI